MKVSDSSEGKKWLVENSYTNQLTLTLCDDFFHLTFVLLNKSDAETL